MKKTVMFLAGLAFRLAAITPAYGHSASTAYVTMTPQPGGMAVELAMPLRDLEAAIGIGADGQGRITWGALRAHQGVVSEYARERVRLRADGAECAPGPMTLLADQRAGQGYAVLRYSAACGLTPHRIGIEYRAFFDIDVLHRGLAKLTGADGSVQSAVLSPEQPQWRGDVSAAAGGGGMGETFANYWRTGVDHLLTGVDHMLFITMLLVPAVLVRGGGRQGRRAREEMLPAPSLRAVFIETAKVLSAFTLAHASTLTLSVLHVISVPERLSESGIALTIVLTALDNLFHFMPARRWPLAFAFGLVHGLGFATALGPLDLPPAALGLALIAFNVGLETAQLSLAALVLPAAFIWRGTLGYRRRVVPGVSALAGIVALAWFADRAAGLGLMPF